MAGEVLIGVEVGEILDVGLDEDGQAPVNRGLRLARRQGGVGRLPPPEFQVHRPEEVILEGEVADVDQVRRAPVDDQVAEPRPPPQADHGGFADPDPPERENVPDGAGRAVETGLMAVARDDLPIEHDFFPSLRISDFARHIPEYFRPAGRRRRIRKNADSRTPGLPPDFRAHAGRGHDRQVLRNLDVTQSQPGFFPSGSPTRPPRIPGRNRWPW